MQSIFTVDGLGVGVGMVQLFLSGIDAPDYGLAENMGVVNAQEAPLQITPCPDFQCAPYVSTVTPADDVKLNARAVAAAPGGEALWRALQDRAPRPPRAGVPSRCLSTWQERPSGQRG